MRIVDRVQLMAMPPGTIFATYRTRGCAHGLYKKLETLRHTGQDIDWIECELLGQVNADSSGETFDIWEDMEQSGSSVPMSCDETSRNAFFDGEGRFLIYEEADIASLVVALGGRG